MNAANAHSYTRALIDAWKRLAPGGDIDAGPHAAEYPGLIDNLFVLSCSADTDLEFRNAGTGMEQLFGRDLIEHDFLSLWRNDNRVEVMAAAADAIDAHAPVVLRTSATTIGDETVELEFTLAPIGNSTSRQARFLGLCQIVTRAPRTLSLPHGSLELHSIERHTEPKPRPQLRLVVSNP